MENDYTNLRAQWVQYLSELFDIWRVWDAPRTASTVLMEMPPEMPVDPEYDGFVLSDTAILFTKGRWRFDNAELAGGSQTFGVGDGAFRHRLRSRYSIIGLDDSNGFMCVRPLDGTIWQRHALVVPNHERLTIGPWPEDRYIFVGRGTVALDSGEDVLNTVPLKIAAGTEDGLTARAATFALLMWP